LSWNSVILIKASIREEKFKFKREGEKIMRSFLFSLVLFSMVMVSCSPEVKPQAWHPKHAKPLKKGYNNRS
jgi:hypothetical protein